MKKSTLFASCAAAIALSGCSLIPDMEMPSFPAALSWPKGPAYPKDTEAKAEAPTWTEVGWKSYFVDPTLQRVIQTSLDNNRDLRVAALNIEVARAEYGIAKADQLPNVNATASEDAGRTPRKLSYTGSAETSQTYSAGVGISSFELDLFGRVHALKEQALNTFLATKEARDTVQISLVAEVANAYLTLLGDQKLLRLTEDTLDTREKSLQLIQRSFDHGVSTALDVAQARSSVETARTSRLTYLRQVDQDKNALALLVGVPLDKLNLPEDASLDAVKMIEEIPVDMPSKVLLKRPDIVEAEYSLKAANANIGAARAAFFPTISLTTSAGFSSPALSDLFKAGARTWSFVPNLSLPIFDAGRNQANLDEAKANRDIAVANYEQAIQTAFKEVANALAAKGTLTDQLQAQSALVDATNTSYTLSQARYDRGIDSYLNVLDSQRSLFSAQQDLVTTQVTRLSNLVTLYKVLGGGRV